MRFNIFDSYSILNQENLQSFYNFKAELINGETLDGSGLLHKMLVSDSNNGISKYF